MVEIVQQAANLLNLAPGWEEQVLFAAGDGNYSYFVVKDERSILRIGISLSDTNGSFSQKLNTIYAMANAFSVPIIIDDTES